MSCGWQNNCQSRPCNHLQNVGATTYKNILQFCPKSACKKHPKGAESSALVYTMVEMAKANDLNVYKYLTYLLEQRPNESMSDEQFEKLTPWNEEVKQRCQN